MNCFRRLGPRWVAGLVTALVAAGAAQAQQGGPPTRAWALTVGGAPLLGPAFPGSDDYALSVFPDLRVNYKDKFFLSIPDGIGYNVINRRDWKVAPLVKVRFGRSEADGGNPFLIAGESDALQGLGDVSVAGEAGVLVQYIRKRWRTRAELRQGFGAHEGWIADLNLSYTDFEKLPLIGPSFWAVGPRLTLGGADFINPYFGIDAGQSQASGLPVYDADGGLYSAGLVGTIVRPVNERVAWTLFASYERFLGDVADSPLITARGSPDQFVVGLAVGYRFLWGQ